MMSQFALTLFLSSMVAVQGRLFETARLLQGTQMYENDDYIVEITGNSNVPKYTFASTSDPEAKQKVMFQKLFETNDGQKIGPSNIALPSLSWVFADASGTTTDEETGVNTTVTAFWINGTDSKGRFDTLAFYNVLNDNAVKFDVIIEGYDETWSTEADALNLVWKMTVETDDEEEEVEEESDPTTEDDTQICFDEGTEVCFSIVETATATTTTQDAEGNDVEVQTDVNATLFYEGGSGITIQYARFEGNLVHDPETGFSDTEEEELGFFARFRLFFRNLFSRIFG